MQLIDDGTQGPATFPAKRAPVGTPGFPNTEPGVETSSRWTPEVAATILAEFIAILTAAGLSIDRTNNAQVLEALVALFGRLASANTWTGANTFTAQPIIPNATGANRPVALGQFGGNFSATNSGGPNISASVSFTASGNGIMIVNGIASQSAGEFSTAGFSPTGCTVLGSFGDWSSGAASNLAVSGFIASFVSGAAVDITFAMAGTGASSSSTNIGFTGSITPTA